MGALKILLLCLSLCTSILAQDTESHRLAEDVDVDTYTIELTLAEDFYESATFTGTVAIEFTLLNPIDVIVLHSVDIEYPVGSITIQNKIEGSAVIDLTAERDLEADYEKLKLRSTAALPTGDYTLKFASFTGKLRSDMYGFYLSSYKVDGVDEYVATTQFQATHARKAFPCFDEPRYKAKFDLTINRPAGYESLSNTAKFTTGNTDKFATTPRMSTYLVAFIVSKFKKYSDIATTQTPNFDVWCREEALPTAEFSYGISTSIMEKFEEITGINYINEEGITKVDQVAIPDFAAGAMENWGLVTYRETNLLWDEDHSTVTYLQRIGTVIAHEFAHMWFGNLVTLEWWDFTWLNEGFARYYQYIVTGEVRPTWELDKQFVIEQLQVIFATDSVEGKSLNEASASTNEVMSKFASTSYSKGASVIRMMVNFLGEENYLPGIRSYLSKNKYGNTVPTDLYSALAEFAPETLRDSLANIMSTWTDQDGYPVVTVSRNDSGLVFTQKRFLFNSATTSTNSWFVPITFTTQAEPNFVDTSVAAWLEPNTNGLIIENSDEGWVLVNILETGYYRVNYADELWDELETALKAGTVAFPDINKAQIVDDALNLARADELTYAKALAVTSFLEDETSYYPWYAAFNAFSFLRKRIDVTSDTGKYLTEHISTMMKKLYDSVSFSPSNSQHVQTLKTALALQWACQLGNEDCIEKAAEQFTKYTSGTNINADIRSTVYCSAVREDETSASWDTLWSKYENTKLATEQITILNALGCSRSATILTKYLTLSITDGSGIRKQDASTVFSAVLAGNPENVNTAFTFLRGNVDAIIANYGGMNALTSVINGIADRLITQEQVNQFEAFLDEKGETLKDAETSIASAKATARANIAWSQTNQEELFNWLDKTYGSAASITLNLSLFVVAVVTVFLNL